MTRQIWPGPFVPGPLGAEPSAKGTLFSVSSETATAVTLCLFSAAGDEERLAMPAPEAGIWRAFVPGVGPGQRYGYRVDGPYDPARGLRSNATKLLLDPYARAVDGDVRWDETLSGDNRLDSAPSVPRSVVVDPAFDWGDDGPPGIPYADSVVYEVHVKGFTARHPDVPPELRGTYAGLTHPAPLQHLLDLGVTAVELLPVHHGLSNARLVGQGLTNYWGYDTLAYFAPSSAYSSAVRAGRVGAQLAEFQEMVRRLHAAGLEVILDVVFNHTVEAGADGPTLCLRGLDNAAYYRLDPEDPARYVDTTGCGNSLDSSHPDCLRLIMDSLRYWVTVAHVDGFRFDLAPTLARQDGTFSLLSDFFDVVHQDPVVSRVKLIAEPWDVGQPDSYDVGRFPAGWTEWNGRFRDTVRDFWRSKDGLLPELANRVTGSPDLYGSTRRRPSASVNLVTAHDGFTLRDLVSYDRKHNEANGEDNRDGADDNRSWSCGAEGPTADPEVTALRGRQVRALLATLLLSRGVPMLLGGDEIGRTQGGNNNAYCQDNPTAWYDWAAADHDLLAFTQKLLRLRAEHPALRAHDLTAGDATFHAPDGRVLTAADWSVGYAKTLVVLLDGQAAAEPDERGRVTMDDELLLALNGWWEPVEITPPDLGGTAHWRVELDTFDASSDGAEVQGSVNIRPRTLMLLRSAAVPDRWQPHS